MIFWVEPEKEKNVISKAKEKRGENGELKAKIASLNLYGDLRIEFSEDVKTEYNITHLNSSNSFFKNQTNNRKMI